jgi:hypothetical protein
MAAAGTWQVKDTMSATGIFEQPKTGQIARFLLSAQETEGARSL